MNPESSLLLNDFKAYVKAHNMITAGDTVIVGLSGGVDSVTLLCILNELKCELQISLKAVHVNHGIRGEEAIHDEIFAKKLCENLGVPFKAFHFNCPAVSKKTGESLEECGRRLRYESFSSLCENTKSFKIATAHNADDNAETVIFNVTRGATVKGASGIPPVRENIIRPLLFASRESIERYAEQNSLFYVVDSSNLTDDYTRNKIRHNVLPELKKINPQCIESFTRFSKSAAEAADFIEKEAEKSLITSKTGENSYSASMLKKLHSAVLKEALFMAVTNFCGISPSFSRLDEILRVLNNGGKIQLYGDKFFEVNGDSAVFYKVDTECEALTEIPLNALPFSEKYGNFAVAIKKYTNNSKKINQLVLDNLIDYDKIVGIPILRTRREGDFLTLPRRNVTKTLKKLFNEAKIPPCERDLLPIISDELGVVWVCGFGTALRCKPNADSKRIYIAEGEKL